MTVSKRLLDHLGEMISLEAHICETLDRLSRQAAGHTDVLALLQEFAETSRAHKQALQKRQAAISTGTVQPGREKPETEAEPVTYPVSAALQETATVLNRAIIGYAMLRTIALRNRDSILAGEYNTGDLAEQHAKAYAGAAHRINQLLHNVVVWELDRDGETCKCTCPSCGLGICLCAQAPRRTLSDTWVELGPISTDAAVTVQQPRPGSVADSAGLQAGDIVVAADGQELDSHFALQAVISSHQAGEEIELRVHRNSGELENISVICPQTTG